MSFKVFGWRLLDWQMYWRDWWRWWPSTSVHPWEYYSAPQIGEFSGEDAFFCLGPIQTRWRRLT